jgi:coenzyme F420-reducing hydrogenase gamma subunit
MQATKPTVGIFGLTGCAGDQLAMLNCEDELLSLVDVVDIRDFLMAASGGDEFSTLDLAFVEGAVMTRRDEEKLQRIRRRAKTLVAVGTCAVQGGVPAMAHGLDWPSAVRDVYGPEGAGFDALPARALHECVEVDFSLPGCPIEKHEFLGAVADLLNGNPPQMPTYAVCTECKMRECACLLVDQGRFCHGPLTRGGCNARCPSYAVPCVGCRGPVPDPNLESATEVYTSKGWSPEDVVRRLRSFGPLPTPVAAGEEA